MGTCTPDTLGVQCAIDSRTYPGYAKRNGTCLRLAGEHSGRPHLTAEQSFAL